MILAQKQICNQWNRIEDPDMNPCSYTHLNFDKGTKNIQRRKDSLFNNVAGKLSICLQKIETRSMFITLY
jgi:hypothetical protein